MTETTETKEEKVDPPAAEEAKEGCTGDPTFCQCNDHKEARQNPFQPASGDGE